MDVEKDLRDLGMTATAGQNFINNEIAVRKFLNQAETRGKTVLEIGPGTGNITHHLDAEKVYLVEKDTVLAESLRKKDFDVPVEVFNRDFLQMELPDDVDYIIGNLPFQHTSEMLERLADLQIESALIVQEELADKTVAAPGDSDYRYFSFRMSYFFVPVKAGVISSRNYYPEPEVDTAVLKLFPGRERHGVEDEEKFLEFGKALFTHRRKKVRNALVDARNILGWDKDVLKRFRDDIRHSEEKVFQLDVKKLHEVFEDYNECLGQQD